MPMLVMVVFVGCLFHTGYSNLLNISWTAQDVIYSTAGGSVRLPCGKEAHSSCKDVSWKQHSDMLHIINKDEVRSGEVVNGVNKPGRLKLEPDCSLTINDLQTEDAKLYTCADGISSRTVSLQLLNLTVTPDAPFQSSWEAKLHCYICTFKGMTPCDSKDVTLTWLSDTGVQLQGGRSQAPTAPNNCGVIMERRFLRTDHNRKWTCKLTKGKEVKASLHYTTTLTDGVREVFAADRSSVALPCAEDSSRRAGAAVSWTWRERLLFNVTLERDVTPQVHRDMPEVTFLPDGSLVVSSVRTWWAGLYQCQANGTVHTGVLLHILQLSIERSADSNSTYTLTCSLTCADTCDADLNLTWHHSSDSSQQGGAERLNQSTLTTQLTLSAPQPSEGIVCVVLREGRERGRIGWSTQSRGHVGTITMVVLVLALVAGVAGAAVCVRRRQKTSTVYDNTDLQSCPPLYEECVDLKASPVCVQPELNSVYVLQSAVH